MNEEKASGAGVEMVTLREAADRLAVSVDTVRRMLKRGELAGEQRKSKQGMTWFVAVPVDAARSPAAAPSLAAAEREELIVLRERAANLERLVAAVQREAESARSERDTWRKRAEASDEAQRELRVILAKALPQEGAPAAMSAGATVPASAPPGLLERMRRKLAGS